MINRINTQDNSQLRAFLFLKRVRALQISALSGHLSAMVSDLIKQMRFGKGALLGLKASHRLRVNWLK